MRAAIAVAIAMVSSTSTAHADEAWAIKLGTSDLDTVAGVHAEPGGAVYTAGTTGGTIGAANLGGIDGWVTKHDKNGALQWKTQFGTSADESVAALGFVTYFGAVVGGTVPYQGSVTVPSAWVRYFNISTGAEQWKRDLPNGGRGTISAVAGGDSAWYFYVVGQGSIGGPPYLGAKDAWMVKYDSSGNLMWARTIGTADDDNATGVAYDQTNGALYVVGTTRGLDTQWIDGGWRYPHLTWVMKYDKHGNFHWKQIIDTPRSETATAVAATADGVYLAGWTDTALAATNKGHTDAWIAYYTAAGVRKWIRQYGTAYGDQVTDAVADKNGNLLVAGHTGGELAGNTKGSSDAWVMKLNSSGLRMWSQQIGTSAGENCYGLGVDDTGGLYLGGGTQGTFGGANLGGEDGWLAKIQQDRVRLLIDPGSRTVLRPSGTSSTPAYYNVIIDRNDFSGSVDLSATGPAGTAIFFGSDPTTGASSTMSVAVSSSAAITSSSVTVSATGSGVTIAPVSASINVITDGSVSLGLSPTSATIDRGQSATFTVPINRTRFPDAVDLDVTGLPYGATASWSADPTTGTTSTLTISTAPNMLPGSWSPKVKGTAQGVTIATKTISLSVTVPKAVTLSVAPSTVTVTKGQSTAVTVNLARTNFADTVNLTATSSQTGVSASFSPAAATGNSATMTISATTGTTAGPVVLTIKGTGAGVTIPSITMKVEVVAAANVTLTASTATRTVTAGQSTTFPVTLTRTNFTGSVALSIPSVPAGASGSFSPASTTGNSSTLTIGTGSSSVGTHVLTINGTASGATVVPTTATLVVLPSTGVTLTATPATTTVTQGGSATYTVAIGRSNFAAAVNIGVGNLPAGVTASGTGSTTGSTATITLTTSTSSFGTFYPTITGTATGVTIAPINVELVINPLRSIASARKRCHGNSNAEFTINYLNHDQAPPNPGNVTSTYHRFVLTTGQTVTLRWTAGWYPCTATPWSLDGMRWYIKPTGDSTTIGTEVVTAASDQTMSLASGNWEINLTETITVPGSYYVLAP